MCGSEIRRTQFVSQILLYYYLNEEQEEEVVDDETCLNFEQSEISEKDEWLTLVATTARMSFLTLHNL